MTEIINNAKICELFGGPFELIRDAANKGEYNMNFDSDRTHKLNPDGLMPMFRLYSWAPYCLSLGANQKTDDIDYEEIEKRGYDIVRRPTGGRAVFHADELTYSVVLNLPKGMNVHDAYREIHIVILNAMKRFTEKVDFEKSQPDFRSFYQNESASTACFASSARYEIVSDKKKIVGSAQRLFGNVLLQHGSILLGRAHEELSDLVKTKDEKSHERLKEIIKLKSASLSEVCDKTISYDEFSNALVDAIKAR